jgi:hypothetical protein
VRLVRRDVRDHIKYGKIDCRRSYRFYRPCGGWNRQHASFARFSKLRDFRVFQHNPPEAVIRALAKAIIEDRGVIAKTRADHLALARNSISPSKSILREGEHRLRITILIAMAYGNATVTARSPKSNNISKRRAPKRNSNS